MNQLCDDILLSIFKLLNLNERTALRSVSGRWRSLIDSIVIKKLVIYQKHPPKPGVFCLTDDEWNYEDTVYAINISEFFDNQLIQNSLRLVEKLGIIGYGSLEKVDLKTQFHQLNYLRITSVHFTNPNILASAKLQTLFLQQTSFNCDLADPYPIPNSPENYKFTFEYLNGKVKRLKLKYFVCSSFFEHCLNAGLWNGLEVLDCYLFDFRALTFCDRFPKSLKRLNCFVGRNFSECISNLLFTNLEELAAKFPDDLHVSVFGLPLNKASAEFVYESLISFDDMIASSEYELFFLADQEVDYHLEDLYENSKWMNGFYKTVTEVDFKHTKLDAKFNRSVLQKMSDVTMISYVFTKDQQINFRDFLINFPNIFLLKLLTEKGGQSYGDEELNVIPECSKWTHALTIENYDKIR